MKKTDFKKIGLIALLFLTAGCAATAMVGGAYVSMFRRDVNIRQTNYAAADYLTQYMRAFVDLRDPIKVQPLKDADQPALETEIGQIIVDQVGERLHDLGYTIDLTDVVTVANKDHYPPADRSFMTAPLFVLSGTYMNNRDRYVDVRLRLVEIGTGAVRAAYDYKLPLSRELQDKAQPKAKIYRVPQ